MESTQRHRSREPSVMDHADEQTLLASTKAGVSDAAPRTMDTANHPSSGCLRKQTCYLQKLHPVVLNYNEVITNLRILRVPEAAHSERREKGGADAVFTELHAGAIRTIYPRASGFGCWAYSPGRESLSRFGGTV